jgi:hypothetical protein
VYLGPADSEWSSPGGRAGAGAALPAVAFARMWAFYVPPWQAARPPVTEDSQEGNESGLTNG